MTQIPDDSVTWLTRETYDRLKAELDYLSGPGRADIAKKIQAARDEGDLSENGGYHAAKDEQGQMRRGSSPSSTSCKTRASAARRAPRAWSALA